MTVRTRKTRDGELRLFIDIRYRTANGQKHRFRRYAQIQTKTAARSEERRLFAELERAGTLEHLEESAAEAVEEPSYTFADAVRQFRLTHLATLKPSTRFGYDKQLNTLLSPRFGKVELEEIDGSYLSELDAELARDALAPSTRRNVHIVFRSVLRCAVAAGLLAAMPAVPKLPKVGRKVVTSFHRDDLDAILAVASSQARLAFGLAAFAGLRAGEVRGLRWSDVDLRANTLTVRRSITRGQETTPKSGDHRVVPLAGPLRALLDAARVSRSKNPWATVALTAHGKAWGESGLNQAFQRAMLRAKRDGLSFHDLRHFFVSELFRKRAAAPVVQRLAGHANLATTQGYADVEASDLRATVLLFEGTSGAPAAQDAATRAETEPES